MVYQISSLSSYFSFLSTSSSFLLGFVVVVIVVVLHFLFSLYLARETGFPGKDVTKRKLTLIELNLFLSSEDGWNCNYETKTEDDAFSKNAQGKDELVAKLAMGKANHT